MATLRNKRKLAAVLRETPENTRNNQSQNTQLSKEFSRTQSRILGALSKPDEFRLNPQVRTCSVAVPGTSRNRNLENWEPTGNRSLDDPCSEVRFSSHHSGNRSSPEVEEYSHKRRFQNLLYEFSKRTSE